MTATMTGYVHADDATLQAAALPIPTPGPDQIVIRTKAVSFNNADLEPGTPGELAGYEFSGDVTAVGQRVDGRLLGQRVMGTTPGAFAEYVVAHWRHVLTIPGELPYEQAAALPTALLTEHGALTRARFRNGQSVLITAATSSIGLIGVQIAKALGARIVIGTTRSPGRQALLQRVGADVAIATDATNIIEAVLAATAGLGANIVLDHVGGPTLADTMPATRMGGTIVSVGRLSGNTTSIDLSVMAGRHLALYAVSFGFKDPETIGRRLDALAEAVLPAVAEGRITAVLDRVFPFAHAETALDRLRAGGTDGKVVLSLTALPA